MLLSITICIKLYIRVIIVRVKGLKVTIYVTVVAVIRCLIQCHDFDILSIGFILHFISETY